MITQNTRTCNVHVHHIKAFPACVVATKLGRQKAKMGVSLFAIRTTV